MSRGTDIAELPKCQSCGITLQIRTNGTAIDDFCGLWYDHPPTSQFDLIGHTSSLLIPSEELNMQLAVLAGRTPEPIN